MYCLSRSELAWPLFVDVDAGPVGHFTIPA
jgi:hypothetical protein